MPPKLFLILTAAIVAAFVPFGGDYLRLITDNTLYSHIPLIPCVSVYLVWIQRNQTAGTSRPPWILGIVPAAASITFLCIRLFGELSAPENINAATASSFVCAIWAAALVSFSRQTLRTHWFAIVFLVFMIPFPIPVEHGIESFLQHGSAECAYWMFKALGTPLLRDELIFRLPGITLEVARECSGIRSSLVLLITSLVGGQLFLVSGWRRGILAFAVIPLALVRNGLRVTVIGELCVQVGPHMIDSFIHHQGGPIFFAISLIPFAGLTWLLMRGEKKAGKLPSR